MGMVQCSNPATHRFTWPGKDESVCCEEHASAVLRLASTFGFHLQVIRMSSSSEVGNCRQLVKDEAVRDNDNHTLVEAPRERSYKKGLICPRCGVRKVYEGPIPCPDGNPRCLVRHYGYRCDSCGAVLERGLRRDY